MSDAGSSGRRTSVHQPLSALVTSDPRDAAAAAASSVIPVAPLLASGLYDISRRLERGEDARGQHVRLAAAVGVAPPT